jgi:hypothetical protein
MDDLYKAALDYVNNVRTKYGKKPLKNLRKGFRTEASNCPITNSVKVCFPNKRVVTYKKLVVSNDSNFAIIVSEFLPDNAFAFVKAFDGGKYPELEL